MANDEIFNKDKTIDIKFTRYGKRYEAVVIVKPETGKEVSDLPGYRAVRYEAAIYVLK